MRCERRDEGGELHFVRKERVCEYEIGRKRWRKRVRERQEKEC